MSYKTIKRERMSIDVPEEEHRKIKAFAALHGETLREYVLESVRERLKKESEKLQIAAMTTKFGQALKEIWDNEKDAAYDAL